jgi:hypothetical protein
MNNSSASALGQDLLANMASIPVIIPGTLSQRKGANGKINGWKLQRWHHGQNLTRYIPAGQVETVREGTAGHRQFTDLAEQYVELRSREALEALNAPTDSKKKPVRRQKH